MTTYLTRMVRFSAAHRYYRPEWSAEENAAVFGACANPYGHGHNYTLEVTVAGTPDAKTGFSANLVDLDDVLREAVLDPLDHQHLNHAIEEFHEGRAIPTTENLVIWIWNKLEAQVPGELVQLRLYEDDRLWVDYFGEEKEDHL